MLWKFPDSFRPLFAGSEKVPQNPRQISTKIPLQEKTRRIRRRASVGRAGTKKVTNVSGSKWPKFKRSDWTPFADLLLRHLAWPWVSQSVSQRGEKNSIHHKGDPSGGTSEKFVSGSRKGVFGKGARPILTRGGGRYLNFLCFWNNGFGGSGFCFPFGCCPTLNKGKATSQTNQLMARNSPFERKRSFGKKV